MEPVIDLSKYAFCETKHASSGSRWHIRKLTSAGRKQGGGADSRSLCGLEVSWDLRTPVTPEQVATACGHCARGLAVEAGQLEMVAHAMCWAAGGEDAWKDHAKRQPWFDLARKFQDEVLSRPPA